MAIEKQTKFDGYVIGATGWRREEDPTARRFVSYDENSVDDFRANIESILENLGSYLDHELSFVNGGHLARLRVELELSY